MRIHKTLNLATMQSDQLDSLRGASAIIVVLAHANQIFIAPNYYALVPWVGLLASSAVMVFFVLSGLLIFKSIEKNLERNKGEFSFSQFFYSRLLRLWPPLILALFLMAFFYLIAPLFFPSGTNNFLPAVGNYIARNGYFMEEKEMFGALFFLNGFFSITPSSNGPLWSLSIEFWYYVIAGLVVWKKKWWKASCYISALVIVWIGSTEQQFTYYLCVWWAGYLLGLLHSKEAIPSTKLLWILLVLFFSSAAVLASRYIFAVYSNNPIAQSFWLTAYFNISIGFGFSTMLALMFKGAIIFPTNFKSVAAYSYSLYILHFPIFLFIFGLAQPVLNGSLVINLIISTASFVGTIAIARILSRLVEDKETIRSLIKLLITTKPSTG